MNEKLKHFIMSMNLKEGVSKDQLLSFQDELNTKLPDDYLDFLKFSNGAKGEIGNYYLEIWSIEEIQTTNNELLVEEFAPGLLLFAGDGANELFGFDLRVKEIPVIGVPMIGMSHEDTKFYADTFTNFLEKLTFS